MQSVSDLSEAQTAQPLVRARQLPVGLKQVLARIKQIPVSVKSILSQAAQPFIRFRRSRAFIVSSAAALVVALATGLLCSGFSLAVSEYDPDRVEASSPDYSVAAGVGVRAAAAAADLSADGLADGYNIHVTADGVTAILRMSSGTGGTVEEVLELAGITVSENDVTRLVENGESLERDHLIENDTLINVERVELRTFSETESIPYKTETKYTNTMPNGKVMVATAGVNGRIVRYYEEKKVDGEIVSTTFLREERTESVTAVTLIGTVTGSPMSAAPFSIELDSGGQPVKYKKLYTGSATAYTNDRGLCGQTTASGRKAQVGVVAVNPKEIPYGTQLYIVSPDGKYCYGYAVAGDTGGFARNSSHIVDLFMDKYEECVRFGRRTMNVYVIG